MFFFVKVLVDQFNAAELKKLRLIVQPYIELCYVIMSLIRETAKGNAFSGVFFTLKIKMIEISKFIEVQ